VSIPSLLESTVDRVPVVFSLDRLDCLLQTETEGQVKRESSNDNSHKSVVGAEELETNNPSNKRLKRDDRRTTFLSVLESSFFQHDVSIQQENALDRLEKCILTLPRS
jgi:hypothetical protein